MFLKKEKINKTKIFFKASLFLLTVILGLFIFSTKGVLAYSDTFTSQILDLNYPANLHTISWTDDIPGGTSLDMEFRAGNVSDLSGVSWSLISNGGSLDSFDDSRYVQYRAIMTTDQMNVSPTLSEVVITFDAIASLISSVYNSEDSINVISGISWSESISGSSAVKFQLRTSNDGSSWSDWCGPDNGLSGCDKEAFFDDYSGVSEQVDNDFKDQSNDKYFQYKVIFISDGINNPIVYDVNIAYDSDTTYLREYSDTLTSQVLDAGDGAIYTTFSWTETIFGGTSIAMEVRAGDTLIPDGNWEDWIAVSNGESISFLNGNRYFQYRATLSSDYMNVSPVLSEVVASMGASNSLISSPYNSTDSANALGGVSWIEDEAMPEGAQNKIYLRSASTLENLLLASWTEVALSTSSGVSSGCDKDGGVVDCNNSAIPAGMSDGVDDQYLQYKLELSSFGAISPVVTQIEIVYVVNAAPEFQSAPTATQISNGTVAISYSVRDSDTDDAGAATPGTILPSFEYSINGGSNWTGITDACLTLGATSSLAVDEVDYTSTSTTWTPSCEAGISDTTYSTTAMIRVTVDDSEAANNTAASSTVAFTLDTKPPVFTDMNIIATTTPATLKITSSDDSIYDMMISLSSDFTGGVWASSTDTTTISLATDPETVYIKFRDAFLNTTDFYSTTTPATPGAMMVQDTSNTKELETDYRLFVAWGVVTEPLFSKYELWRSSDNVNYSIISTSTDININYYSDTSVSADTLYYYKVNVYDQSDSTSYYSSTISAKANGVQDYGEGGGGTEGSAPTISNVATSSIYTTQATITWTTDELSNSTVGYDTAPASFLTETGIASMVLSHSITLTGLTPGEDYYFKVKSEDSSSNIASSTYGTDGYMFTTLSGPSIATTSINVSNIQNNSATINWTTDIAASSTVVYSTNSNMSDPSEANDYDQVLSHSLNLTGLTEGIRYYYYIVSETARADNGGSYYYFTTTRDSTGPVITFDQNTDITNITDNSATVSWTTDEPASSTISWGLDTSYASGTESNINKNYDHSFNLSGLTKGTEYHIRLLNTDQNNNTSTSSDYTFTTTDSTDTTAPTITIAPRATSISDTWAIITWLTNEASDSVVNYSSTSGIYTLSSSTVEKDINHAIKLTELSPETIYYFYVTSTDNNSNSASSTPWNFTTLETQYNESEVEEAEEAARNEAESSSPGGGTIIIDKTDKNAPVISDIKVTELSSNGATIEWSTDEEATSITNYQLRIKNNSGNNWRTEASWNDINIPVKQHKVKLYLLDENSIYDYQVVSQDSSGNLSLSETKSFTTLSYAEELAQAEEKELSYEEIEKLVEEQEEAEEKTAKDKDSVFMEAVKKAINIVKTAASEVSLSTLESTLMLQENSISELASSIPAPLLSGEPKVITTATGASIAWRTDKSSNSLVALAPEGAFKTADNGDGVYLQVVGNPADSTTEHVVSVYDLEPDTLYHYQLRSQSSIGPIARSRDFTFTTQSELIDVTNYTVEIISPEQAIFKWVTNVESDSTLKYTPYRDNVLISDEARTKHYDISANIHEMEISDLEAGINYKVELISQDIEGREARETIDNFSTASDDLPPLITQVQTKSAISPGKTAKVQTIISWVTNELSTSKVYFQEGIARADEELAEQTGLESSYTKKHVAVITKFDPGKVYSFRVESIDSGGNKSISKIYTILTPRQQESVFQIIMKNLEEIFGWVGAMKR